MAQLELFKNEDAAAGPRPPDPAFVRKHLTRVLGIARGAQRMPWRPADADAWARRFPELTKILPADEGEALQREFEAELARLRTAEAA